MLAMACFGSCESMVRIRLWGLCCSSKFIADESCSEGGFCELVFGVDCADTATEECNCGWESIAGARDTDGEVADDPVFFAPRWASLAECLAIEGADFLALVATGSEGGSADICFSLERVGSAVAPFSMVWVSVFRFEVDFTIESLPSFSFSMFKAELLSLALDFSPVLVVDPDWTTDDFLEEILEWVVACKDPAVVKVGVVTACLCEAPSAIEFPCVQSGRGEVVCELFFRPF